MGWRRSAYGAVRPLLFRMDPESIHHLALRGVAAAGALPPLGRLASGVTTSDEMPIERLGLRFRNRVGLAAGFDKDGVAARGWAALGFGFVELGTVTPRAQPGNPRPRLVRLPEDEALINRMGFNNAGAAALAERITAARRRGLPEGFVVGVNVGRNRDGEPADYGRAARAVAAVADYLVINVSSPNTPGVRNLQDGTALRRLLGDVREAASGRPVLVKLSPDLDATDRARLVEVVAASGGSGVILSNTTTARDALRSPRGAEAGGLSGRPREERTADAVTAVRSVVGSTLLVVASGGVGSGNDARALVDAGADLVQLWTGMLYAGPGLIGESIMATAGC
jgi:dihydroorotate dehydrogenase